MVVETDKLLEGVNGVLIVKGFLVFVGLFRMFRSHHFQICNKNKLPKKLSFGKFKLGCEFFKS